MFVLGFRLASVGAFGSDWKWLEVAMDSASCAMALISVRDLLESATDVELRNVENEVPQLGHTRFVFGTHRDCNLM